MNAREAAYRSLLRTETEGRYSNLETDLTLKSRNLSEEDARLYTRLVYGTIEKKLTLRYHLGKFLKTPFEKLDPPVQTVLSLGAYQILYADRIPDSAAVNESVNLMKKSLKSAASLVNAVLRKLSTEKNNLCYPDKEKDPIDYLSVYYSVSTDVARRFYQQFGFSRCCSLFEKMNELPKVALRVNTLKTTGEELLSTLKEKQISTYKSPLSEDYFLTDANVTRLEELKNGLCFVQDLSSGLAVRALHLKKGMRFIDTCSCPGGKSFCAAMEMENEGEILSFDLHENKLSLVKEGAKRLSVSIIQAKAADARIYLPLLEQTADVLLADVPCSGLGVIAKKPDLRYKKEEDLKRLPEIQEAILNNVCNYVKVGGIFGISTCTVLKEENEEQVERFLLSHPNFKKTPLNLPFSGQESMKTFYPDIDGTDGFFIATLQRVCQ